MPTYYIGNHGWVTRYPAAELDSIRNLSNRGDTGALHCLLRRAYPPRERTEKDQFEIQEARDDATWLLRLVLAARWASESGAVQVGRFVGLDELAAASLELDAQGGLKKLLLEWRRTGFTIGDEQESDFVVFAPRELVERLWQRALAVSPDLKPRTRDDVMGEWEREEDARFEGRAGRPEGEHFRWLLAFVGCVVESSGDSLAWHFDELPWPHCRPLRRRLDPRERALRRDLARRSLPPWTGRNPRTVGEVEHPEVYLWHEPGSLAPGRAHTLVTPGGEVHHLHRAPPPPPPPRTFWQKVGDLFSNTTVVHPGVVVWRPGPCPAACPRCAAATAVAQALRAESITG